MYHEQPEQNPLQPLHLQLYALLLPYLPDLPKSITVDDAFVMAFEMILRVSAIIPDSLESIITVGLLQDHITHIGLILQKGVNGIVCPFPADFLSLPDLPGPFRGDASFVQALSDLTDALTGECPVEDFLYNLRLFFIYNISTVYKVITIRG